LVSTSRGFYLAVGFIAVSLGEKYPGVERFEVRRPPQQLLGAEADDA
jgi:hypothetical protein